MTIRAGWYAVTIFCMSEPPVFDANSVVPLYVQAADMVAALIAGGELAPGQKLPAERDLAIEWGVAYLTARRAVRELRERGLVVSRVGKGTFVTQPRP